MFVIDVEYYAESILRNVVLEIGCVMLFLIVILNTRRYLSLAYIRNNMYNIKIFLFLTILRIIKIGF